MIQSLKRQSTVLSFKLVPRANKLVPCGLKQTMSCIDLAAKAVIGINTTGELRSKRTSVVSASGHLPSDPIS